MYLGISDLLEFGIIRLYFAARLSPRIAGAANSLMTRPACDLDTTAMLKPPIEPMEAEQVNENILQK